MATKIHIRDDNSKPNAAQRQGAHSTQRAQAPQRANTSQRPNYPKLAHSLQRTQHSTSLQPPAIYIPHPPTSNQCRQRQRQAAALRIWSLLYLRCLHFGGGAQTFSAIIYCTHRQVVK